MAKPKRIFIIDDEREFCEFVAQALQLRGFKVVMFFDAESALKHPDIGSFSLGLVDLNLPHKHGATVADALRSRGIDIPLIAMSAYISKNLDSKSWDRETLMDCGFSDTMDKPVAMKELYSKVAAFIS